MLDADFTPRTHCELYPRALHVTQEIIDELRDIVLHALGGPYSHPRLWCILLIAVLPDLVTSDTSTVSWKIDQLDNMIKLIDGFGSESCSVSANLSFKPR
jgi:hypothetical protein